MGGRKTPRSGEQVSTAQYLSRDQIEVCFGLCCAAPQPEVDSIVVSQVPPADGGFERLSAPSQMARKAHFDTYRTRIRTLLPFRPSLLGGVSCVYNRVQRSRLNGQPLNGQRNGHLHCTRRSVEDRP